MTDYNKALLDQLLAHVPCAVYWRDRQGRYAGCNQLFAQHVRLPVQDIIGKIDAQLPWGMQKAYHIDQEVIRTNAIIERIETVSLNNQTVTLRVTRIPLMHQGNVFGVLGLVQDVSELFELRQRADATDQLKVAFIRDMEHDIRTPLTGVFGLANMLLENEADPQKKEGLTDITNCSQELLEYCNGILDISKIESNNTLILAKPFDLKQVMESVFSIEKPIAKSKQLKLTMNYDTDLPTVLIGDIFRIKRILINLISNAIKFTHQGYVHFSAICLRQNIESRQLLLALSVEDSGVGIPDNKKDWIYEKFSKVDLSNTGHSKGHGLGLHIVKRFVHELDGDVHVKTKLEEGSTFTIHIPLKIPLADTLFEEQEQASNVYTL